MSDFLVTSTQVDRTCTMIVSGEVDIEHADEVATEGLRQLADENVDPVAINLMSVEFIDSTGIGALVQLRLAAEDQHKHLLLVKPSERVSDLLRITALGQVFAIEDL